MRRKTIFIHNSKKYSVKDPTVGMYWTFLVDIEQFLEELFYEYNTDVPMLDKKQTELLIEELFGIKTENLQKLFKKITKKDTSDKVDDFHILVGKYIKFFPGENYVSVMKIPMGIFNKMLADLKIFSGEQEYQKDRHSKEPDKKGMKELFNNQ